MPIPFCPFLLAEGREGTICLRECPYQALVIVTSEDGFETNPVLDLSRCNGCGACQAACPVHPRPVLQIVAMRSRSIT